MKKPFFILLCAGGLIISACNEDRGTTTETNDPARRTEGPTPEMSSEVNNTSLHREQADKIATQMATDLQLDEQSRNRVQQVYYNRAVRIGDLEKKNNTSVSNRDAELNNNVGVSNNAGTDDATGARIGTEDNPAMDEELQTIQKETEEALRGALTPDQFKRYQANRSKYEQTK